MVVSLLAATVGLSRFGRKVAVVVGLWLTSGATFLILHLAETRAIQGQLAEILAAWGPHLLPLAFAAVLHRVGQRALCRRFPGSRP